MAYLTTDLDTLVDDCFLRGVLTVGEVSFFFFLAVQCGLWDFSSLTRNQTHAFCSGSVDSEPLDLQGSP